MPASSIQVWWPCRRPCGVQVTEHQRWRGFVQELHIARDIELLTFNVTGSGGPLPSFETNPHYYLQQLWDYALTVRGQRLAPRTQSV